MSTYIYTLEAKSKSSPYTPQLIGHYSSLKLAQEALIAELQNNIERQNLFIACYDYTVEAHKLDNKD